MAFLHVDVSPQHPLRQRGSFTGLFVGAAKRVEATQESAEQAETDVESETDSHPVPEESEEVPA